MLTSCSLWVLYYADTWRKSNQIAHFPRQMRSLALIYRDKVLLSYESREATTNAIILQFRSHKCTSSETGRMKIQVGGFTICTPPPLNFLRFFARCFKTFFCFRRHAASLARFFHLVFLSCLHAFKFHLTVVFPLAFVSILCCNLKVKSHAFGACGKFHSYFCSGVSLGLELFDFYGDACFGSSYLAMPSLSQ